MQRPRRSAADRALELAGDFQGVLELGELFEVLLDALHRAVPSAFVSINDVGPTPGEVTAVVRPPLPAAFHAAFARHAEENPILQHVRRTGDGRPHRFSDVSTPAELHATGLYREVYGPLGVEHQVAFTVRREPRHLVAVALSREAPDYSLEDVRVLERTRPFLAAALRSATEHTALLARLDATGDGALVDALVRAGLSAREAAVLREVARGRSNGDVARRLQISERTVEKHLERTFRKLGVSSRSEAAARVDELLARAGG